MSEDTTAVESKATPLGIFPSEIWYLVAEQVNSSQTLKQLLQVSRALREILEPILHRKHSIHLSGNFPSEWISWAVHRMPYSKHMKDFEINLGEFKGSDIRQMSDVYDIFLAQITNEMPKLQTFRWTNQNYSRHPELSALIIGRNRLFKKLKACQTLKHLSISMGIQYSTLNSTASACWRHLKGFRHLTSLELYQLCGDENPALTQDIAFVLKESPALTFLGLAHVQQHFTDGSPPRACIDGFVQAICQQYAGYQAVPLGLKTLKLGTGMTLTPCPTGVNYLKALVKLDTLETLHVYNIQRNHRPPNNAIDWTFFGECKSVRQLGVLHLTKEVCTWLNERGSTCELFVSAHLENKPALSHFNLLSLPRLSLLYVRDIFYPRRESRNGSQDEKPDNESKKDLKKVKGSKSGLRRGEITTLDRLHDGGIHLIRLALCLDFRTQWNQFETHLPKLKLLTHLRIVPKTSSMGFPLRGGETEKELDETTARRYVKLAKARCPSLKYAQVGIWAWQIIAPQGTLLETQTDIQLQIHLQPLDLQERESIELFSFTGSTRDSGLVEIDFMQA